MAEEMIPVNILLADRTYRIKTSRNDEESKKCKETWGYGYTCASI
jgi:hypothetical protein